jgi:hypothetical protein
MKVHIMMKFVCMFVSIHLLGCAALLRYSFYVTTADNTVWSEVDIVT